MSRLAVLDMKFSMKEEDDLSTQITLEINSNSFIQKQKTSANLFFF